MIVVNQSKDCFVNTQEVLCITIRGIGTKAFVVADLGNKEINLGQYSKRENAISIVKRIIEMIFAEGIIFYMPEDNENG